MTFSLEIECDNAAFETGLRYEIERIVRRALDDLKDGAIDGKLRDVNGNTVGEWSLED